MRKTATTVTVATLILSVFGAFFRWLQLTNAFDPENGLPTPFHGTTIVYLVYSVLAVAIIVVLTYGWLNRYDCSRGLPALRCSTVIPRILGWVFGVCFALGSCAVLFQADYSTYPLLQRLFGAFGILGGLCFPFLPAKADGSAHSFGRLAAAVSVLFGCYWLIFCYRMNAEDPVRWSFAVEILAVAAIAVALYYIAGFHYGAGTGRRALLAVQLAVFFDVSALFDPRSTGLTVMFFCIAAMLLTTEYLIIENLREKPEVDELPAA